MCTPPSDHSDGSGDLLVTIIETLETCGLPADAYQLHDYVDVEALERLHDSSAEDVAVQFSVQGVRLDVSPESVRIIEEHADSTGE